MAQYYLVKDGQRVGPLAIDQLTQYGLTPETLVWTDGMTDWVQASQIPEVAALLAPKPAPAPAPAPQPAPAPAPQPVQQPQPQYQAPQPQYQQPQPQYQQPYQQAAMGNYVATPQLGFMDAVKICLKKYFDFKGRARRSEYWWFMLAIYIVNAIINGVKEPKYTKNREYSMFDMYPTILSSIGFEIEGNKLGFGVDLYSEDKTMIEILGKDKFDKELKKSSDYYDKNIFIKE